MYGICHLSVIPVRIDSTSKSELVSQLIYGEFFKVIQNNAKWFYIESIDDNYKDAEAVITTYVEDAVNALLPPRPAGRPKRTGRR